MVLHRRGCRLPRCRHHGRLRPGRDDRREPPPASRRAECLVCRWGTHAGSSAPGWSRRIGSPGRVTLEGTAGYVFLERPRSLTLLREDRTGDWHDIKESEPSSVLHASYATAWIDHGASPQGASYAYVLLPGADPATTAALARAGRVVVLANTPVVQAVKVSAAGFVGASFAQPGLVKAGSIVLEVSGPASVSLLTGRGNRTFEVAVSDATRSATTLDLSVSLPTGRAWRVSHSDPTVAVTVAKGRLDLRVRPDGTGNAHRVRLTTG